MAKKDVIFFDDGSGSNSVKRKEGFIEKIESGLVYFCEDQGKVQLIPVCRIIRIEKGGMQ